MGVVRGMHAPDEANGASRRDHFRALALSDIGKAVYGFALKPMVFAGTVASWCSSVLGQPLQDHAY